MTDVNNNIDSELAGACSRFMEAEAKYWLFINNRLKHRKDLGEPFAYENFAESIDSENGPAFSTYWRQIMRLTGSRKKALSTYKAYVALSGELP